VITTGQLEALQMLQNALTPPLLGRQVDAETPDGGH
jgi:hypothetical protein